MVGDKVNANEFEHAITAMFKPPALQFSRSLRKYLDSDPDFLNRHEMEVLPELQRFLKEAGVPLDGGNANDEMRHVIREVVIRLRSYEKGRE
jgi:hypothetical protein